MILDGPSYMWRSSFIDWSSYGDVCLYSESLSWTIVTVFYHCSTLNSAFGSNLTLMVSFKTNLGHQIPHANITMAKVLHRFSKFNPTTVVYWDYYLVEVLMHITWMPICVLFISFTRFSWRYLRRNFISKLTRKLTMYAKHQPAQGQFL